MDKLGGKTLSHIVGIMACMYWVMGGTVSMAALSIIPLPASIEEQAGSFVIDSSTQVIAEGRASTEAAKLIDSLAPAMGFRLKRGKRILNSIQLDIDPSSKGLLGSEGYELDVTTDAIKIRAGEGAGLFYGIQTLRELLPPAIYSKEKVEGVRWVVPCVHIIDYPQFQWRGLLIDPARHFIPVKDVERFINIMALHKFNRLQIHFTDNEGWRIEIKKHPRLTQIGAWMDYTTMRRKASDKKAGSQPPGGFYTQDEIRHLVWYAAQRYVFIVPEIEMPAHTGAAIVAYPRISLYPEKLRALEPAARWKANEKVLAPRPQTVAFMQDVLAEVIELFPSEYVHIGGDEANISQWAKSEEMQSLKQLLSLKDEAALHSWFIRQMDEFLSRRGRRLIGWDEILQGGLAAGATVMSWRGQAGGITAAKAGHDVVMAPTSHTYFDYYQGPKEKEPLAIGGNLPLEKVYTFEPVPAELNAEQAKHILGGQGQLWGEYIDNQKHREYMACPRATALSEVLWSPRENRSYEEFLTRLKAHLKRLDAAQVNYRPLD